jgi:glycosyltransferase involved in cell wall biosynthesis
MKVLICAPDIFSGDAVGNHCLGIARMARRLGLTAELYAQRHDAGSERIRPIAELFADAQPDDVLCVSYSIFDPFLDQIAAMKCAKVCYFHGVTDPELLREFEPRTAEFCQKALEQLPVLGGFDSLIANSRFSAEALRVARDPAAVYIVPPVFADMYAFRRAPSKHPAYLVTKQRFELLTVGRVVPHKRVEDSIGILRKLRDRGVQATLSVVGSMPNYDYSKFLINHARKSGVLDHVDFKGVLDDDDLLDRFEEAAVVLVTSRHEGFCVPVLEGMYRGKHVLVRAGTAAEELCPSEAVLAVDADTDSWADSLATVFSASSDSALQTRKAYMKRAQDILSKTDDLVWSEILTRHAGNFT